MSPWGLAGGGPMNDQQIDNLVAYLQSIQVDRRGCEAARTRRSPRRSAAAEQERSGANEASRTAADVGEALFNLGVERHLLAAPGATPRAGPTANPQSWRRRHGPEPHQRRSEVRQFPSEADHVEFVDRRAPSTASSTGSRARAPAACPASASVLHRRADPGRSSSTSGVCDGDATHAAPSAGTRRSAASSSCSSRWRVLWAACT